MWLHHCERSIGAAGADDLAQETFVLKYRKIHDFRGDAAFSSWLLGIAHNQFRNIRRRQREIPHETPPEPPPSNEPTHADNTALRQDLGAALSQLTEDEQTVLTFATSKGFRTVKPP